MLLLTDEVRMEAQPEFKVKTNQTLEKHKNLEVASHEPIKNTSYVYIFHFYNFYSPNRFQKCRKENSNQHLPETKDCC